MTIAPPFKLDPTLRDPLPELTEAAGYVRNFKRFQLADRADLLIDGRETYPAMLRCIDGAKRAIDLETYILAADNTGWAFQKALLCAAKRGVRVRLLYDYIGALGLPDGYVVELLKSGVSVRVYHPLILLRPGWAVNRRDHRKLLIVDGKTTFTGGINISDQDAPKESGGQGWRDTHMQIDGTMVADWAGQLYEYVWRKSTPYHETATPRSKFKAGIRRRFKKPITLKSLSQGGVNLGKELRQNGKVAVRLIGNREVHRRRPIREAYLHAIDQAKRYILIENAYFIPDHHIRSALIRAVGRGVQVAVVVAKETDVQIAGYASRAFFEELLSAGIRIFQWPRSMMHAKTAVIDDIWSVVGSFNFDHRSLRFQLEIVAVIAGPAFARKLRQQTLTDIAGCEELTLEKHRARRWYEKLFESIAYKVRYWL